MVSAMAGEAPTTAAREAASSLSAMAHEPAALVTACRRLVQRQPTCGPLWWLGARVLSAADPTPDALAAHLAEGVRTVAVVGWPELAAQALDQADVARVLVVESAGDGAILVRRLCRAGLDATLVPARGSAAAAAAADLVLLEAEVAGPDAALAPAGSRAAAAVGRHAGVPVWLVAGVGRVLPPSLWSAARASVEGEDPWEAAQEHVPADLVEVVVGPAGPEPPGARLVRADCDPVPELAPGG